MFFVGLGIGLVLGAAGCWLFIYQMAKVAARVETAIEKSSEHP